MKPELSIENLKLTLAKKPDFSMGSSDVYIQEEEVIKVLKSTATVYQFCVDCSPNNLLALLEHVKTAMLAAFGNLVVESRYCIEDEKVIITQKRVVGDTLKDLSRHQIFDRQALDQGIVHLRATWQGDPELLGYIIDEILDPTNVMFDGNKLVIIDWI